MGRLAESVGDAVVADVYPRKWIERTRIINTIAIRQAPSLSGSPRLG